MRQPFHPVRWWKIILAGLAGAAVSSGYHGTSRGSRSRLRRAQSKGSSGHPSSARTTSAGPRTGSHPRRSRSAARLVSKGKIYQLGRLYEHGMPIPGKRHFSLTIPGTADEFGHGLQSYRVER